VTNGATLQDPGTRQDNACLTDAEFTRFRGLIVEHTGINLKDNKRDLLVARLTQHIRSLGLPSFTAYYEYVVRDSSGEALRDFINRITTNKTSFFREPHHFEFLRARLIPDLRRRGQRELRIWSAGCSTGEEPYSIAMTVEEALGKHHGWNVRILATDIDTQVLERAQAGTYPLAALEGFSPEHRRAWFLRGYGEFAGHAQVRPELRRMVEFQRLNFKETAWNIRSRFDLIFCRNVIIYFERSLQQLIVGRLAAFLKPDGYFFSGHSENLFWLRDLLLPVEPTVYRLNKGKTER
jgi:chemotaxis protein methyltransferase CheR